MNRYLLRGLNHGECETLLDALGTRQHLQPHEPVSASLAALVECVGVCPQAVEQAATWLQIDAAQSIGRLRRTELTQLARSIHRYWRRQPRAEARSEPTERRP